MPDVIDIRDFYNHETRIALLEKSVGDIGQSLIEIKQSLTKMNDRLDKINDRIDTTNNKIDSNLKWMVTLAFTQFSGLFALIAHTQHWII